MSYDAAPVQWDHELIIGDTYAPGVVQLADTLNADGTVATAFDLTGATGTCALAPEPGAAAVLSPTVALVVAADGTFQWTAPASATADLQPGRYRYSVRLTFSDGTKRTIVHGTVTVRREVTS